MASKKKFIEDEALLTLANEVIAEHKLDYINNARVKFMLVDPYISKTTIGKCLTPSHELKHFGQFDYLIEISKKVWDAFDDNTKKTLLWHWLKHIYIDIDAEGDKAFKIIDHTVQDFAEIIKVHGVEWITNVKAMVSSVYDFQNGESDRVKI